MNRVRIIFICIVLGLVSCRNRNVEQGEFPGDTKTIVWEETDRSVDDYVDSVWYVPLSSEGMFSTAHKLLIDDKYIYCLDFLGAKAVLQYGRDGSFVRQVGSRGRGPGEFIRVHCFTVLGDTVVLLDQTQKRLLRFDRTGGGLLAETAFSVDDLFVTDFCLLESGNFLVSYHYKHPDRIKFGICDGNMELSSALWYREDMDAPGFLSFNVLRRSGNRILGYTAAGTALYEFGADGGMKRQYHLALGAHAFTAEQVRGAEDLFEVKEKHPECYLFFESPLLVGNYLIGRVSRNRQGVYIVDLQSGDVTVTDMDREDMSLCNMWHNHAWVDDRTLASVFTSDHFEDLETVAVPDSLREHLLEGGAVVAFYRLKE